jgi:hypothetical protein
MSCGEQAERPSDGSGRPSRPRLRRARMPRGSGLAIRSERASMANWGLLPGPADPEPKLVGVGVPCEIDRGSEA